MEFQCLEGWKIWNANVWKDVIVNYKVWSKEIKNTDLWQREWGSKLKCLEGWCLEGWSKVECLQLFYYSKSLPEWKTAFDFVLFPSPLLCCLWKSEDCPCKLNIPLCVQVTEQALSEVTRANMLVCKTNWNKFQQVPQSQLFSQGQYLSHAVTKDNNRFNKN